MSRLLRLGCTLVILASIFHVSAHAQSNSRISIDISMSPTTISCVTPGMLSISVSQNFYVLEHYIPFVSISEWDKSTGQWGLLRYVMMGDTGGWPSFDLNSPDIYTKNYLCYGMMIFGAPITTKLRVEVTLGRYEPSGQYFQEKATKVIPITVVPGFIFP